jgi:CDP-diacylglycerol--serine O-phosphatidyltransferase
MEKIIKKRFKERFKRKPKTSRSKEDSMKRIYLLPNIITAFGLACGLFVIFKTNMIEPGSGYFQVMNTSALLLLLAAFADFMDGAVARALKVESDFGLLFDTLSDAISFGVAPSVLLLKSLSLEQGTWTSFITATGAMIFSLCGVLRLVRFTVKALSAKDLATKGNKREAEEQKKHFTGLPIPAAAAAAVSALLLFLAPFPFIEKLGNSSEAIKAVSLSSVMLILGYFMVCRLKFLSLKSLKIRVPSFHLALIAVAITVGVLYGILHFFALVLALVSWGYILVALTLTVIRKIAGRKSKTLKEFEPEEDDLDDSEEE